jgi:hypothetical protein
MQTAPYMRFNGVKTITDGLRGIWNSACDTAFQSGIPQFVGRARELAGEHPIAASVTITALSAVTAGAVARSTFNGREKADDRMARALNNTAFVMVASIAAQAVLTPDDVLSNAVMALAAAGVYAVGENVLSKLGERVAHLTKEEVGHHAAIKGLSHAALGAVFVSTVKAMNRVLVDRSPQFSGTLVQTALSAGRYGLSVIAGLGAVWKTHNLFGVA